MREENSQITTREGGDAYQFSYSGTAVGEGLDPGPAFQEPRVEKSEHRGYVGERAPETTQYHPSPAGGRAGLYHRRALCPGASGPGQRIGQGPERIGRA